MKSRVRFDSKQSVLECIAIERGFYLAQMKSTVVDYIFARPARKISDYLFHLRMMEYYSGKYFGKVGYYWHYFFKTRLSYKLGFQIPCGTCGVGLKLCHYGSIVINSEATIGNYCKIYPGLIIGSTPQGVPQVGDNVWIGGGVKIVGKVTVGSNVIIAPNSVVIKDIPDNCICGGAPAKILKEITKENYSTYSDYINPFD